jgi:hypothetical protein
MGQTKATELQEHIEPEKVNYRMARAVAPRSNQSWLDATKETGAGIEVDRTPEKRWYTALERDMTTQEKVASAIGSLFRK